MVCLFLYQGCRDTFTARRGRFAFDGTQVTASSVQDCGDQCLSSAQTCYGYDWNGQCFLHLNKDNLNNLQTGTGVTNYLREFKCNPTNQPSGAVTQPPGKIHTESEFNLSKIPNALLELIT